MPDVKVVDICAAAVVGRFLERARILKHEIDRISGVIERAAVKRPGVRVIQFRNPFPRAPVVDGGPIRAQFEKVQGHRV